jgi:hypothetical protein
MGVEVLLQVFLISTRGVGEWLTSRPTTLLPGESLRFYWLGGSVYPTVGMCVLEEWINVFPVLIIEPRTRSIPRHILFGWRVLGRSSFGLSVGKHRGKRPLEDLVVDGRLMLKWALKKWGVRAWSGFIWRRIGTNDGFQEVWGISWLSEDLLPSNEELRAFESFGRFVSEAANHFATRIIYYLVIWLN